MSQDFTEYVFIDRQGTEHYEMVSCRSDFWDFYKLHDATRGMSLARYQEMKEKQADETISND